jgi:hypothetical protein
MPDENRSGKLWWAAPAAVILALLGLAMFFGNGPEKRVHGSSYDASPHGFRAAYLLLEELGYPVVRSKRLGVRDVRWVLFPTKTKDEAAALKDWVRQGGILLLADDSTEFAAHLGMTLRIRKMEDGDKDEEASGLGVAQLAGGSTSVRWPGQSGDVRVRAGDEPFVTVHQLGDGEVWLMNRPEFVTNALLPRADNAVLLTRLATDALNNRPGRLAFDEYFHGMRDRPGVTQLLFQPPALWVTLQALLLLGLVLWHYMPRFGSARPLPPPSRRSKEEFLNALAALLERKGDRAAAFETAADDLARELERELGLPAGTPVEVLAREAGRHRPIDSARLLRLLTRRSHAERGNEKVGAAAFVQALNELETIREEFLRG